MRTETLEIKYSTSRGRDTYGYTLVSLYVRGKKVASTCGGGYDMTGTVIGDYLQKRFQAQLMKIGKRAESTWDEATHKRTDRRTKTSLYGMTLYLKDGKPTNVVLDGACGVSSMQRIAEAMGLKIRSVYHRARNLSLYEIDIPERTMFVA